ncbi:hypothetical protein [Mesorhizobium sp. M2D.F.Ca.ET.232.01.1.1]|nr:hypothetical protein [Mesorhizobium sp. M2D.F.Ca.ET.232.01.1.1]
MPTSIHSFPEIDRLRAEIIASSARRQRIVISLLVALIGVGALIAWSL